MTDGMKLTIAGLSNERLEAELSRVYWTAYEKAPGVRVREVEGSLLALLWEEFDARFEEGTIDRDPLTGNEYDPDDFGGF